MTVIKSAAAEGKSGHSKQTTTTNTTVTSFKQTRATSSVTWPATWPRKLHVTPLSVLSRLAGIYTTKETATVTLMCVCVYAYIVCIYAYSCQFIIVSWSLERDRSIILYWGLLDRTQYTHLCMCACRYRGSSVRGWNSCHPHKANGKYNKHY